MLKNTDHGVFAKINELAACYGLESRDFVATLERTQRSGKTIFTYTMSLTDRAKANAFDHMLTSLRLLRADADVNVLTGEDRDMIKVLDYALKCKHNPPDQQSRKSISNSLAF